MSVALVAALSLAVVPVPQEPSRTLPPLLVPIHSQADDPLGGTYGLWAAGPDYKVSFHDGFAFHPYVPDAERTRAWRWRTSSVRCGDRELLTERANPWHDAWRFELRSAGVIERYDVRADGVEQSFVVNERPHLGGSIAVEGVLESEFAATPCAAHVGSVDFTWRDRTVLRYGAALAIDALGHEFPVTTAFDGRAITLQVAAEDAALAAYPLTIDPLTSTFSAISATASPLDTTIACSTDAGSSRVAIGVVRRFSATDTDAYLHLVTDDPGTGAFLLFSDVTTSWSTPSIDLAQVAGAGAWALALERSFTGGSSAVRVYVHALNSSNANTGTVVFGASGTAPRIGGAINTGSKALVVYGASNGTDAHQQILDAQAATLGAAVVHQSGASHWSVSKLASPGTNWCVASKLALGGAVRLRFVDANGTVSGSFESSAAAGGLEPEVDGDGSRFLMAWRDSTTLGTPLNRLRTQRVAVGGGFVGFEAARTIASSSLFSGFAVRGLAYDYITQSHWALAYERNTPSTGDTDSFVVRLGHSGAVTELVDFEALHAGTESLPCVAFNGVPTPGTGDWEAFAVGYAVDQVPSLIAYRRFDYSPATGGAQYGSSCSNHTLGDGHPPFAGSEFYRLNLVGIPPLAPAFLGLGVAATDVSLAPIGMPGCRLLVDLLTTFPASADANGNVSVTLALSDAPLFIGDLYAQWIWIDAAANPTGLRTSRGIRIDVR